MKVKKQQLKRLINKKIYAFGKDGTVVEGKLVKVSGQKLYVKRAAGNKVHTKGILPLALFDLLAVGAGPYAYGGYGAYNPYDTFDAVPYGYGYTAGYGYPTAYGYPAGYGYPGIL